MSGYNYGHASLFWNEIIYALETMDDLPEERRVVSLVSPWIRDLSLGPSNLSSDDWADLFDMPGRDFSNLSDVLLALADSGFTVTVLTLDAEDKALPKQNGPHLVKEENFVRKLTQRKRDGLKVLKKFGIHNKLFCFPHSVLVGSVNMTHRGMLGNSESLVKTSIELDQVGYRQHLANAHALLDGSVDYALGNVVRFEPPPEPTEGNLDADAEEDELRLPPLPAKFHEDVGGYGASEDRLFNVGQEPATAHPEDDEFLTTSQVFWMYTELSAFEKEFRQFILSYYHHSANLVKAWDEGEHAPLSENWHRLIFVQSNGERVSMHDKAANTIRRQKLKESDMIGGVLPDLDNLTPDEAIVRGSTLGDLRSLLIGNPSGGLLALKDFNKNDLADKALSVITARITGRALDDAELRAFWSELFAPGDTPYNHIQWARNAMAHPNEISWERAARAKEGIEQIRRSVFNPWNRHHPADTMP